MRKKFFKGILLAGGKGTRLHPTTKAISKHLIPVFDKPMIFYSLSVLMLCKIKDIAIITTAADKIQYFRLLGNGKELGIKLTYITQNQPRGIAHSIILCKNFIKNHSCCLVLGDNIFYGQGFSSILNSCMQENTGSTILCHPVLDTKNYGILHLDNKNKPLNIIEKPKVSKSNLAVTGIYFYDKDVVKYAKKIKPSKRGELEISDLNNQYIKEKSLKYKILGRGFSWLDTGNHERLFEAAKFVEAIQSNQGYMISCLEEISLINGWINKRNLKKNAKKYDGTSYGDYLKKLL